MNFTSKNATILKDCEVLGFSFQIQSQLSLSKYKVSHVILVIINSIFLVSTLVTNSLTIITFWKSSQLRKKVSFLFVLVQSIVDLTFGVIASSLALSGLLDGFQPPYNCTLRFVAIRTMIALVPFTLLTLTGLNLERYFGIVHPISHRTKLTTKLFWKYILFSFVCTVISFGLSIIRPINWIRYSTPLSFIAFLIGSIFIYCKIFSAGAFRRVNGENVPANSQQANGEPPSSTNTARKRFEQDIKLAKSCLLVVICFICACLPVAIIRILSTTGNLNTFDFIFYRSWTGTLFLANPTLNSYIFFWRNRLLRSEAVKVLRRK